MEVNEVLQLEETFYIMKGYRDRVAERKGRFCLYGGKRNGDVVAGTGA